MNKLTQFTIAVLMLTMPGYCATWGTWNGATAGSSAGNISSLDGRTIGTSTGNYGAWNGLVSPGGGGTFSFVQGMAANDCDTATAASVVCTLPGNFSSGNVLTLGGGLYPGVISSVTDCAGNTWHQGAAQNFQNGLWYAIITAGGCAAVTINMSPDSKADFNVLEFTDMGGTPVFDKSSTNTGTSLAPTGTAITPAAANELFVSASVVNNGVTQTLSWTGAVDKGFTGGGQFGQFGLAYKISTGSSAETAAWTIGSSQGWGVLSIAFKP